MFMRKRCRYCRHWFNADPRVKERQIACEKPECKKKRKEQSQRLWVARNPHYFEDRYENTRAWLKVHPGYLRKWRRRSGLPHNSANICDKGKENIDIQDEIMKKGTDIITVMEKLPCLQSMIYKTRYSKTSLLINKLGKSMPMIYKTK